MSQESKIILIKELVETAEISLKKAKLMLNELTGEDFKDKYAKKAEKLDMPETTEKGKIIEGIYDGEKMIDKDGENFPVPVNYASKSKLVPGDALKLTINDDGSFVYKQIGPVERKQVVGTLTYEDGQYKVIAGKKTYKVLLASVTYYKAEIGDKVTLIIPEKEGSEHGAIDNIIPKNISDLDTTGDF